MALHLTRTLDTADHVLLGAPGATPVDDTITVKGLVHKLSYLIATPEFSDTSNIDAFDTLRALLQKGHYIEALNWATALDASAPGSHTNTIVTKLCYLAVIKSLWIDGQKHLASPGVQALLDRFAHEASYSPIAPPLSLPAPAVDRARLLELVQDLAAKLDGPQYNFALSAIVN